MEGTGYFEPNEEMATGGPRPASWIDDVLTDEEDAFGLLLLDFLTGAAEEPLLERADGYVGPALGAECFFAPYGDWPETEQAVFDLAEGRTLDLGCGAGRHSLEAQKRGLDVVAIDISPGALAVSARRGVRDVRLLPLAAVDEQLGRFDTILMMCGNFGLVGTASECQRMFRVLDGMTTPTARIILDTVDPYKDNDAADLTYQEHNRARGRMAGQVTIRIRYRERTTPWFELLNVSPTELEALVGPTGWRIASLFREHASDYYAVLEKERRQTLTPR